MFSRRSFLRSVTIALAAGARMETGRAADPEAELDAALANLDARCGGRLGVAVIGADGRLLAAHRAEERFPLCSTCKALIVAATLARIDAGAETLDRSLVIAPGELLAYAPVARTRVGQGMTISELCDAAITISDNTAANKLVGELGGPAAVTGYLRSLGDDVTRLDRTEPDLNQGEPGDARDTTRPFAMARTVLQVTTGAALSPESRNRLVAWLIGCKTGTARLRAGLPGDWRVGDKTGSGGHGATNDVAIVWPHGGPPIVIAAYLADTPAPDADKNAIHAAVARAVAHAITK